MELTAHQCGALVVLDVARVALARQRNVRDEVLLLKIADGKLVRVRQQMEYSAHARLIVLQVVHHQCSVAFYLKLEYKKSRS